MDNHDPTALPGDSMGHDHLHTLPTTDEEADAFVAMLKAMPEAHAHMGQSGMVEDHEAMLALVARADATHVAISNGDWFDTATWHEGRIPGEGAKVLIPDIVTVRYDGESNASLSTVRVDGELKFSTSNSTRMVVETIVNAPGGRLEIGTADNPIGGSIEAKIIFANNGDIDTSLDPRLLSRGLISHGDVEIHGEEKTGFVKIEKHAMAGDTALDLLEIPTGWEVGDKLVISGTHKTGFTWDGAQRKTVHVESQDEEVTIVAIDGDQITFDRPLAYDHDVPRVDLNAYVANLSRSITFSSEDGDDTPAHQRGHVMFMHNDNVDVRYAAFDDLGRTDKSVSAVDVATLDTVSADSNIKGRYSVHFHKTGTEDTDNPAMAVGNAVDGSVGWGFVHHSSHADFLDNVAFDVFGAAFAAEDGDETGVWANNMAIRAEGFSYGDWSAKNGADVRNHDNGRTGDGFFFAGRMVEAQENVAINTTHGFVWMHRSAPSAPLASNYDHPETALFGDKIPVNDVPIQGFRDNEAFGTAVGLIVLKANPDQEHDIRTVLDGFLNWETSQGVNISYTSHYTLTGFDILATESSKAVASAGTGVSAGTNSYDLTFVDTKIEGFREAFDLDVSTTFATEDSDHGMIVVNPTLIDNRIDYKDFNPARQRIVLDEIEEMLPIYAHSGDLVMTPGQSFYFDGIKTDSLGEVSRDFAGDANHIRSWNINAVIKKLGYWENEDGTFSILIPDFAADRLTGAVLRYNIIATLNATESRLEGIGAVNHGLLDMEAARALTYFTHQGEVINLASTPGGDGSIPTDPTEDPGHEHPGGGTGSGEEVTEPEPEPEPTIPIDAPIRIDVNLAPETDSPPLNQPSIGTVLAQITAQGVPGTFSLGAGSSAAFAMAANGDLSTTANLGQNRTHVLNVTFNSAGLLGSETMRVITGNNSDQTMTGTGDDDIILAMGGIDIISGGLGDDMLFGQTGNDQIGGGDGRDVLAGGRNNDTVTGGEGDDTFFYLWGDGIDMMNGGAGNDRLFYQGIAGSQNIGVTWNGTAVTQMQNITSLPDIEQIHLDLADGIDAITYTPTSAAAIVNLVSGTASGFASIAGIENVTTGGGADTIVTSTTANRVSAGNGDDMIVAAVDDLRDIYVGGGGSDTLDLTAYGNGLSVDLGLTTSTIVGTGSTAALSDLAQSMENLLLGAGADMALGNGSANLLVGGSGNDTLGGINGNDTLIGGIGDDLLTGGTNTDLLTGGVGEDVFLFSAINHSTMGASDVITDFEGAGSAGGDLIDISFSGLPFIFIGNSGFALGGTNQIRVINNGADTLVQLDIDADGGAEAQIRLLGLHNLTAADFML